MRKEICIKRIITGPLEANCYILWDSETMDGVVIDPGQKTPALLEFLDENPIKIKYIIATHGHFDHMLYTWDVMQKTGAKAVCHKLDAIAFEDDEANLFQVYTCRSSHHLKPDILVQEGDSLTVGDMVFTFLDTPGHTPGSMCILFEDILFSGDTLFRGEVGRSDLARGNASALMASLRKLSALEGDYRVLPGHMEETTLSRERRLNPYMQDGM